MQRRALMTGACAAALGFSFIARAQQPAIPVIGFLRSTSAGVSEDLVLAFRQGLSDTGFVDGRNVRIEYRWAEHQIDRLPLLIADLLRQHVVLIVGNTPVAIAAKAATASVPIVFATGSDPVADGLVASLNRPGANVTGVSFASAQLAAKQLGILRELRPGVARIGVVVDPNFPTTEPLVSDLSAAASATGQQLVIRHVSKDGDIETALAALAQLGIGALVWGSGGLFLSQRERIAALTAGHGIPAMYVLREYVTAGGLM